MNTQHRRHFGKWLSTALFALAILPAHALDPVAHADLAGRLVQNVQPANNTYNSDGLPTVVTLAGVNGASEYKNVSVCAPFITSLVKLANGLTDTQFRNLFGSTSPNSALWKSHIVTGNRFVRRTRAEDIRRGDILAISYGCPNETSSGHTMIAMSPAERRLAASDPVIADTVQYELRVADSSSSLHSSDTRAGTGNGAGEGIMRVYADATTGEIRGYTWSLSSVSVYYDVTSCRQLAVGTLF